MNDATMCLSQLLEALISCALIMYSRPPYSSKYATVSMQIFTCTKIGMKRHRIFLED